MIRRAATNRVLNVLRHWVSKHSQVKFYMACSHLTFYRLLISGCLNDPARHIELGLICLLLQTLFALIEIFVIFMENFGDEKIWSGRKMYISMLLLSFIQLWVSQEKFSLVNLFCILIVQRYLHTLTMYLLSLAKSSVYREEFIYSSSVWISKVVCMQGPQIFEKPLTSDLIQYLFHHVR